MRVQILAADIAAFRRSWPCSGLPHDVALSATFDDDGTLTEYEWASGEDYSDAEMSGAMSALLDDARDGKIGQLF